MSKLESYVATTTEVDIVEVAVKEILAQIPLEKLKKNTLGIIACHYEFGFSGVLEGIAEALPFDTVGTISSAQGSIDNADSFVLAVTVLTSDEVEFATALSAPLENDTREVVGAAYNEVAGKLGSDPDLILIHGPFMLQNNGDDYLAELNEISHNTPLFGTLAVDDTPDFKYCYCIYNGQTYGDRLVLSLLKGVEPKFYSANISTSRIVGEPALITASEGAMLSEVNDRPIAEYLAELGLATLAENGYAMSSMPFILDYGDGTPPISRIFIMLTPDGNVILNGSVPVGATFVLAGSDKEDVLKTTCASVDEVLADPDFSTEKGPSVVLIYSCVGRFMTLGADNLAEIEQVKEHIGTQVPFAMAYSGGEYCPTEVTESGAVNRFHNNALVMCAL